MILPHLWLSQVPVLSFSSFDTESEFDFVYVHDGEDDTATQLHSSSGTDLPDAVTATDANLYVKLTSDSGVEGAGFTASFECQGGGDGDGGGGGRRRLLSPPRHSAAFSQHSVTYPLRSFSVVEVVIVECAPGCIASWVDDGFCDDECNHPRCGFDGTDCGGPPDCAEGCPVAWRADGYCDDTCNNGFCNFDDGDCGGNGGGGGAVALCQYENDGTCDVPNYCPAGTDHDDCGDCEDVPGWDDPVDSSSTGCEGWVGYDCNEVFSGWSTPSVVLQACPATCGLCGVTIHA